MNFKEKQINDNKNMHKNDATEKMQKINAFLRRR